MDSSFQSWTESPVKTTIETPVTEITFPKVTVCPPKNTYTDLNYDLLMTENMTLDNDTRQELTNYALELLYDKLYEDIMRNMSKLDESERYYNWYHGYSEIQLPYFSSNRYAPGVKYKVSTYTSSGSISTQYFGEQFDADKVETGLLTYSVWVYPLASVRNIPNVTLHIDVEKVSLEDLSSGADTVSVLSTIMMEAHRTYNFTPPTDSSNNFVLRRDVLPADVRKQKLDVMPELSYTWHYSGVKVEPEAIYYNSTWYPSTMAFVGHYSSYITVHHIFKY